MIMKEKKYVAMLSGGRDSTAMVEYILSKGMPLDYIITADTLHEFPQMYEYLDKFEKYLQDKYGMSITRVEPSRTFEDWVFGKITRGERKGMIRGLPKVLSPCWWTREAKIIPVHKWIDKNLDGYEIIEYIGYTYSELKRSKVKATNQIYPLIDARLCEADVDKILESIDMVNPLYEFYDRTGCYFCIKQGMRARYVLYKKYPEQWEYMKGIEEKLQSMDNVLNDRWFMEYTLLEHEEVFNNGTHKHLRVEAPKSCECNIEITETQYELKF